LVLLIKVGMKKTIEIFDSWNKEKQDIHWINKKIYISPREVWYIKMW
jgi:hypothetical protein